MLPILVGLVLGIAASWAMVRADSMLRALPQIWMNDWPSPWDRAGVAHRVGATGLRLVGLLLLFGVVGVVVWVVRWDAKQAIDERVPGVSAVAAVFYGSHLLSVVLGFVLGAIVWNWFAVAQTSEAKNVAVTGIAVASLAAAIFTYGLNNEFRFLDRLNKISASVVTIELEKSQRADRPELDPSAAGGSQQIWAADERIGFALLILEDLGKALGRDSAMLKRIAPQADLAVIEKNRELIKTHVLPAVEDRKGIHAAKRDINAVFFDSERMEQPRVAHALRDLILADIGNGGDRGDSTRDQRMTRLAVAYARYLESTHYSACLVETKTRSVEEEIKTLEEQAKLPASAAALAEINRKIDGLKQNKADLLKDCVTVTRRPAREDEEEMRIKAKAAEIKSSIPSAEVVRSSPYMTIIAATMLYGAGEREAAVALLGRWRRAADAASAGASASVKVRHRIFAVRVLNLMGLMLADRSDQVQLELSFHYQQAALDESRALIGANGEFSDYASTMRFPKAESFDMIASAAIAPADRRNDCPTSVKLPSPDERYLVQRKSTLVNNVAYFLSIQPHLLEQQGMAERLDELISELRAIRVDCIANLQFDQLKQGRDWEELRADALSGTLDTLARALSAQASLHRTSPALARQSLCDAYRAAVQAERLDDGRNGPLTLSRADILAKSFAENGNTLNSFGRTRGLKKQMRDLRDRVIALGENACGFSVAPK